MPLHLKELRGNPGKRALNNSAPEPETIDARTPPPAHVAADAYALAEWNRRVAQLTRLGIMTEVDDGALALLCVAWSRWRQAEEAVQRFAQRDETTGGLMIRTAKKADGSGGNAIQNPLVGTANKAMEMYLKLAVEFGMTPSSRARISVESDDKGNPYAQFGPAAGA